MLIATLLLFSTSIFAQGRHNGGGGHRARGNSKVIVKGHPHGPKRVVVVSKYRPAKMVVYHPYWRPAYAYHRRWVYFPRYNFYWDNWRNGYYYMSGPTWIFNTTPPPAIININIDNEKNYELKDSDDDIDDVYKTNEVHKTDYKPE